MKLKIKNLWKTLHQEKLNKYAIACTKCHKIVAWNYMTETDWCLSLELHWELLCPNCYGENTKVKERKA